MVTGGRLDQADGGGLTAHRGSGSARRREEVTRSDRSFVVRTTAPAGTLKPPWPAHSPDQLDFAIALALTWGRSTGRTEQLNSLSGLNRGSPGVLGVLNSVGVDLRSIPSRSPWEQPTIWKIPLHVNPRADVFNRPNWLVERSRAGRCGPVQQPRRSS
ncbi:hypothetical protein GZL_09350 [Streptomyces sp. 769]|nr:hypothetical protein GZL_00063 [Streptomyces sp. 769]AJC61868.1 hypothetical protein GZL_09350 [Streptomyces sp. 769]